MDPIYQPDMLSGRVALVTGGGTGIGLEVSTLLASLGAHVVLAGRRPDVVERAASGIVAAGHAASSVEMDVREYPQVKEVVDGIVRDHGGMDILINNAAGNFRCDTEELTPNGWRTIIDIDLNGTFNCCHAAFSALSASPHAGRIVSVITSYAWSGWPGCAPAASAKAGIQSLMRTLAVEWGDRNIRCNSVAPGMVADTEGTTRIHDDAGRGAHELSRIPVGHPADRIDIANAIAYLVSPGARYVNGADLVVDGGRQFSFGSAATPVAEVSR